MMTAPWCPRADRLTPAQSRGTPRHRWRLRPRAARRAAATTRTTWWCAHGGTDPPPPQPGWPLQQRHHCGLPPPRARCGRPAHPASYATATASTPPRRTTRRRSPCCPAATGCPCASSARCTRTNARAWRGCGRFTPTAPTHCWQPGRGRGAKRRRRRRRRGCPRAPLPPAQRYAAPYWRTTWAWARRRRQSRTWRACSTRSARSWCWWWRRCRYCPCGRPSWRAGRPRWCATRSTARRARARGASC